MTDTPANPLLATSGLPKYDAITPELITPGVREMLARAEAAVADLEANLTPTWNGLIEPLEDLDKHFEYGWQPVGHLFGVKNSPELRAAYEEVLPEVIDFGLRVSQSEPLYQGMKLLQQSEEYEQFDSAQKRILDAKVLDAELAGIALTGDDRKRFNELSKELSKLKTEFSNHVLDATKRFDLRIHDAAVVEGMPQSALAQAADSYQKAAKAEEEKPELVTERETVSVGEKNSDANGDAATGPWRFTLDIPSYLPFMKHCRDRALRERLHRAFTTRASEGELDNAPLIKEILKKRQEKAALLGYKTYADLSLATKMASTVDEVEEMLTRLRDASWEHSVADFDDLKELAEQSGQTEPLAHWDVAFYSERLRESRFELKDEDVRPYFPLERVLGGLYALLNRLFGVTVEEADGDAPVWHEDVRYCTIKNEAGETIAAFYLDPYTRPEDKRGGAWMADCLSRRITNGQLQIPVAHLVCNSTPPVGKTPSLMTFREVETLFHEFGHGLQHMLTTVDHAGAAGIANVEWDAVELPSQFMENWCYHKPTLIGLTAHYETGEPLPDEYFEKLVKARTFQAGTLMLRQLLFGMTDLELHHRFDPESTSETVFDVHRRIAKTTQVMQPLEGNRFLCAFEHIFAGGYSAGYYSYKWAEVLSADAFSAFEEAGLDNDDAIATTGRRFRDTVLAQGGSRHPMEIFEEFRGRGPSPEPLLKHNGLG